MRTAGILALMLGACAAPAPPESRAAAPAAPVSTPILETTETMSGQPIALPQGAVALAASRTDIPAGGRVPVHKHLWPRFVYVEKGWIELVNHDAGITRAYGPGDVVVEPVGQWHEGRAMGGDPVRLIAYDTAPPGKRNVVLKDPPPQP